jgi:hypothetical protein
MGNHQPWQAFLTLNVAKTDNYILHEIGKDKKTISQACQKRRKE